MLQQIHYWLGISKHQIEGKTWVNTYEEWQKRLPFYLVSSIKDHSFFIDEPLY